MKTKNIIIMITSISILLIVFFSQVTFFIIQPIGAVPKGKTLLIWRLNKTNFIDSADAMCVRERGGVSLMCRLTMMGAVAKNATIITKLPYSEYLFSISTDGNQ